MTRCRTTQDGFTLVEVLVVVMITGLLMAGLAQAARYGTAAWTTQTRAVARYEDLEGTDRVLRYLFGHSEPVKPADGAMLVGDVHRFRFLTVVPGIAALGTQRAAVVLYVNARRELVLRWSPLPGGGAPNAAPRTVDTVLLPGVAAVEFRYWGAAAPGDIAGWHAAWNRTTPPELVAIHLVFPAGDGRRWPDILAARRLD